MSSYLEKLKQTVVHRRRFLALGGGAAATAGAVALLRKGGPFLFPPLFPEKYWRLPNLKPARSPVAILRAANYEEDLVNVVLHGMELCGLAVKDKSVLLKPNLVEFADGAPINTNPALVGAAIEAFRHRGAKEVIVGEGAGHRRDTELLVEASGLGAVLRKTRTEFTDLNLDDVALVKLRSDFMGVKDLYFSRTLQRADLVVSMPKLKTHHWVGVTLGMKNLYGCVPGAVYGWPKNFLHWCGIPQSIVDIAAALRPGFTIVDGIVGMEGNGPISGTAKPFGAVIFGIDVVAVDATCARLMGFDPAKIPYLAAAGKFIGRSQLQQIEQRAEPVLAVAKPFQVLPQFEYMRA
jgi:uncharacterized protein (DUF362 family)